MRARARASVSVSVSVSVAECGFGFDWGTCADWDFGIRGPKLMGTMKHETHKRTNAQTHTGNAETKEASSSPIFAFEVGDSFAFDDAN